MYYISILWRITIYNSFLSFIIDQVKFHSSPVPVQKWAKVKNSDPIISNKGLHPKGQNPNNSPSYLTNNFSNLKNFLYFTNCPPDFLFKELHMTPINKMSRNFGFQFTIDVYKTNGYRLDVLFMINLINLINLEFPVCTLFACEKSAVSDRERRRKKAITD